MSHTNIDVPSQVTSGATAVTCILKRDGEELMLYTSNVGDSRAVIFSRGRAVRLTKDHKVWYKVDYFFNASLSCFCETSSGGART